MRFLKFMLKAFIGLICGVLCVAILVLGGLNLAKFAIYSDYYAIRESIAKNPGLSDGFVCQGIGVTDDGKHILVSGYMNDDSASRIYITDKENNSRFVTVTDEDGKAYDGHMGGIAVHGDKAYIASGKKINIISLDRLLSAECGTAVAFEERISTNNSASFIYASQDYLYVGEFHDGGKYVTDHKYTTPEGERYAIASRYSYDDLTKPDRVYSIPNKVQGICFTPDGKIVLSTSYGLSDSVYYVYSEDKCILSENTLDGAPVYYLDACERQVKGPAMAEGLAYLDGKVITLTESASDKYIFGKFFFAYYVVGLDFGG